MVASVWLSQSKNPCIGTTPEFPEIDSTSKFFDPVAETRASWVIFNHRWRQRWVKKKPAVWDATAATGCRQWRHSSTGNPGSGYRRASWYLAQGFSRGSF